ncbi:MAG: hypothetical protein ACD_22C00171G0012 [uncultured bacterium]|nr:MAG: hypothetical protein ACD_22C00171G0012 [uncultured bacterium]
MNVNKLLQTPLSELDFSVVDVETTGMSAQFNRIMDIGIVKMRGSIIVDRWQALIDPKQDVPYWITFYTHLSNTHVKGQPSFDKFAPKILELLSESVFVAHNVSFDYGFVESEYKRLGVRFEAPKICTVKLGRGLLPQLSSLNLDSLSKHYNIEITDRHRALPDAEATAIVLSKFIDVAQKDFGAKNFMDLSKLQRAYMPFSRGRRLGGFPNLFTK